MNYSNYFILTKDKDNNQNNELMYFENKNIYILPSNNWVYYKKTGLSEKPLINWFKQFCDKNKNFLDIGSQTGIYTISLADKFNHVYSFEPHKNTYYALCGGIVLSKLKNVTCFQFGLGSLDQCGKKLLNVSNEDRGRSSLHEIPGIIYTEEIKIKTLDQLQIDNISFIKIDVENNEYNVLLGAKKTLKDSSYPMIILEVNFSKKDFVIKTIQLLKKYGYCIYNINGYTNMLIAIYNKNNCNSEEKFEDSGSLASFGRIISLYKGGDREEAVCDPCNGRADTRTEGGDSQGTTDQPAAPQGSAVGDIGGDLGEAVASGGDIDSVVDYFKVSNSYYESGNFKKSIKFYNKYIESEKRFDLITKDKIFLSKLRKGICYKKIGNFENAIYFFLDAYDYCPERLESIYEIVYHYRIISKHRLAYNFYKIAKKIFEKNYISEYMLKFYVEYTIIAAYIGKYNINDKIVYIMNNSNDNIQLLSNMKFYKNILIQDKIVNLDQTIECYISNGDSGVLNEKIKFYSSSSCMIENIKKDGYILNIRYVNYYICEKGNYILNDCCNNNLISINKYIETDLNFNVLYNKFFDVDYTNRKFTGIEDLRLYRNKQDTINFIGTGYHKNDKIGIVEGIYDIHKTKLVYNEIESPFKNTHCEKNWIYVDLSGEDPGRFSPHPHSSNVSENVSNPHIIYKWYPLQIYKYNDNSMELIETINTPKIFSECRGSTCGVNVKTKISQIPPIKRELMDTERSEGEWVFVEQKYKTEIWFVLHIVSCETPRNYYHIIAVFDINMNLLRYSAPFKFEGSSIEYCLSILVEEEKVLINYSTWDRTTRIGIYKRKYIESLLKYI